MKDDNLDDVNPLKIAQTKMNKAVDNYNDAFAIAEITKNGTVQFKDLRGGYCPQCDTVWAAPGKCMCDPLLVKYDTALNVFAREIWNGAIAKCIAVVESGNLRRFEKETLVKYMKEE